MTWSCRRDDRPTARDRACPCVGVPLPSVCPCRIVSDLAREPVHSGSSWLDWGSGSAGFCSTIQGLTRRSTLSSHRLFTSWAAVHLRGFSSLGLCTLRVDTLGVHELMSTVSGRRRRSPAATHSTGGLQPGSLQLGGPQPAGLHSRMSSIGLATSSRVAAHSDGG